MKRTNEKERKRMGEDISPCHIDSEIICIGPFGRGMTPRTRGHGIGWRSFPGRKKSPFPSAHLLQLGQWKSHQGCKSRTMELFALHRQ